MLRGTPGIRSITFPHALWKSGKIFTYFSHTSVESILLLKIHKWMKGSTFMGHAIERIALPPPLFSCFSAFLTSTLVHLLPSKLLLATPLSRATNVTKATSPVVATFVGCSQQLKCPSFPAYFLKEKVSQKEVSRMRKTLPQLLNEMREVWISSFPRQFSIEIQ